MPCSHLSTAKLPTGTRRLHLRRATPLHTTSTATCLHLPRALFTARAHYITYLRVCVQHIPFLLLPRFSATPARAYKMPTRTGDVTYYLPLDLLLKVLAAHATHLVRARHRRAARWEAVARQHAYRLLPSAPYTSTLPALLPQLPVGVRHLRAVRHHCFLPTSPPPRYGVTTPPAAPHYLPLASFSASFLVGRLVGMRSRCDLWF